MKKVSIIVLILVIGIGIPAAVLSQPDIRLSGNSHDYGDVVVGDDGVWWLYVYNDGDQILSFLITSNNSHFATIPENLESISQTVSPGASFA